MTKEEGARELLVLDRMGDVASMHKNMDPLYSFALDELLCRSTGRGGPAICHIWRHPRAFIMGLRDSRLPGAGEAQRWLESDGWAAAVRHSGGAAVPLDLGVVNVSLILPKTDTLDFHFHSDFERMYELIRAALADTGRQIDKGEIAGAYCPGDYDLSIGGLKFCGIAQRRQTHAYIVQAFVIAAGSGRERAQLVRSFYERAAAGALSVTAADYPAVTDTSTASLEELAGLGGGAAGDAAAIAFADAVKRVIRAGQTEEGMRRAAAALDMPSEEQIREMICTLRERYTIRDRS
ncbi:lipoate--protein ligase family protein [Paenibacillus sp. NEAU-GSW1]|uniref:lipoate--protein ligase family protein n=1 Tax=Paenibacillus sp. NEAU-GSW1 TaxID=2682486 RepID=UPI0012E2C39F|nr:lipoate--protein ligase family protein [Paenibacillus sp. NEAU-GSW1]MUT66548.1 lipoate--protein ligase family protein [Paenibacillus sp. NEAU-GSW1]